MYEDCSAFALDLFQLTGSLDPPIDPLLGPPAIDLELDKQYDASWLTDTDF